MRHASEQKLGWLTPGSTGGDDRSQASNNMERIWRNNAVKEMEMPISLDRSGQSASGFPSLTLLLLYCLLVTLRSLRSVHSRSRCVFPPWWSFSTLPFIKIMGNVSFDSPLLASRLPAKAVIHVFPLPCMQIVCTDTPAALQNVSICKKRTNGASK